MANIIELRFSGKTPTKSAKYLYTGVFPDKDCLEALATNFYNAAPSTDNFSFSNITNPLNIFDKDNTTFALGVNIATINFPNFFIIPHAIRIEITSPNTNIQTTGNNITAFFNYLLDTNTTKTARVLQSNFNLAGHQNGITTFLYENLQSNPIYQGYLDSLTLGVNGNDIRIYNISVFGEVFKKDNTNLPPTKVPTTLETFTDSFLPVDLLEEGVIVKKHGLTLNNQRPYKTILHILTTTLTIPSDGENNTFILNPNNAARNINLPLNPLDNHYVRLININGNFPITIYDSNTTTVIQELSNSASTNMLEAVWNGSLWIVTT